MSKFPGAVIVLLPPRDGGTKFFNSKSKRKGLVTLRRGGLKVLVKSYVGWEGEGERMDYIFLTSS